MSLQLSGVQPIEGGGGGGRFDIEFLASFSFLNVQDYEEPIMPKLVESINWDTFKPNHIFI